MGTCTTTSTNPDKIAYQKSSDARKRAKLTKKLQALKNACTKSHKHERQEGGPIDADTLFQDDDPHHQAAAETLRDTRAQAECTGPENDTSALLVDALRTTKADIRTHDTAWKAERAG